MAIPIHSWSPPGHAGVAAPAGGAAARIAAVAVASAGSLLLLGSPGDARAAVVVGVAVAAALAALRWAPELFLVLFAAAGPFESSELADGAPVNLTTVGLLGLLAASAVQLARHRARPLLLPAGLVPLGLIAALVVASTLWTTDPDGGLAKALTFQAVTSVGFLAPIFIVRDLAGLRRALVGFAGLGLTVALLAEDSGHPARPLVLPGSDNEIAVGQLTGLGLIAMVVFLWTVTRGPWRLLWLAPAGFAAAVVVGAGSRGALLGAIVALAVGMCGLVARRSTRTPALALLLIIAIAAPVVWAWTSPEARDKQSSILELGNGLAVADASDRAGLQSAAVEVLVEHPLGAGAGAFADLTGYEWPHNILLELGSELGLVAVGLFLALVALAAIGLVRAARRRPPEAVAVAALLTLLLVLSMSSFDLNGNRVLWMMLGLALAVPAAVGVPAAGPLLGGAARPERRARRRRGSATARRPHSIARSSAEVLLTRAVEVVLQVALLVLTARLLGPEGRGLYALASLTALLCVLPLGSVWTANATEFAHGRTRMPDLLGASIAIALVGGCTTGLAALALAPVMGEHVWVIAIPASIAPLLLLARYEEGLYQTLGQVRAVTAMILARVMLPLAAMTPAMLAGAGARTAVALWAASLGLLPLIFLGPLVRRVGGVRLPRKPALYRRLLGTNLKLAVGNSALLLTSRIALIALAIFTGDAAVGVYSVAVAAADILLLGANALDISSFHSIAMRGHAAAAELALRSVRHAGLLALAGALLLVPLTLLAVPPVLGPGYEAVPLLLAILAPGVVVHASLVLLDAYFAVRLERPARVTAMAIGVLAATVPLTFALVPFVGVWGAALAATVGNLIGAALYTVSMRRLSGARLREFVPGSAELRDYVALARGLSARARPGGGDG